MMIRLALETAASGGVHGCCLVRAQLVACVVTCVAETCVCAENCPGMVGPLDDGYYYCTHQKAGYCDRRSGACFCYNGYSGPDCSKCKHTHYEEGALCLEKSACDLGGRGMGLGVCLIELFLTLDVSTPPLSQSCVRTIVLDRVCATMPRVPVCVTPTALASTVRSVRMQLL